MLTIRMKELPIPRPTSGVSRGTARPTFMVYGIKKRSGSKITLQEVGVRSRSTQPTTGFLKQLIKKGETSV